MKGYAFWLRISLLIFLLLLFLTSLFAQPMGYGTASFPMDKSGYGLMVGASFKGDINDVPGQGNPGFLNVYRILQNQFVYTSSFRALERIEANGNDRWKNEHEPDLLSGASASVKAKEDFKIIPGCKGYPHHLFTSDAADVD